MQQANGHNSPLLSEVRVQAELFFPPPATPHNEEDRRAAYWRALIQAWHRALGLAAAQLPEEFRTEFSAKEQESLAALFFLAQFPASMDAWASSGANNTVVVILQPRPLLGKNLLQEAIARQEQYLAWQRLLWEIDSSVAQLGNSDIRQESLLASLELLAGKVRELLEEAQIPWFVSEKELPRIEDYSQRLSHSALLQLLLAEARLQAGLPQQAIEAASRAIYMAPEASRARYIRALAHWRLQQLALAEEDMSIILARATSDSKEPQRFSMQHRQWLRTRGALRLLRQNTEGMCSDFLAACALGDCEGLLAVREKSYCLPPASDTDTYMSFLGSDRHMERPARFGWGRLAEGNDGTGMGPEPPLPDSSEMPSFIWPPIDAATVQEIQKMLPVIGTPQPDPFLFPLANRPQEVGRP